MVGLADVQQVEAVQPGAARADLVAGERGADVAEDEAVGGARLGEGGVEVVGGAVDGGALGLGQAEADGAEPVEAGVAEDDDVGVRGLGADRRVDGVELAGERGVDVGPGGVDAGQAVLSDWCTQVVMTSAKPASLPPTVMVTRAVEELRPPSWFARTSPVRAPEHAAKVNEDGAWAAFQR